MTQGINKTAILEFVQQIGQDEAKAQSARMGWFHHNVVPMSPAEIKQLFKEAAAQARADAGLVKGDKEKATAEVRLSEAKQLYGAEKFAALDVSDKGWHASIEAARKALKQAQVKWDGQPAIATVEMERARDNKAFAKAFKEITDKHPNLPMNERLALTEEAVELSAEQEKFDEADKYVTKLMQDVSFARIVLTQLSRSISVYDETMQALDEKEQKAA